MTFTPPTLYAGVPVYTGRVLEMNGESWVTLIPEDDDDNRLWEFSLTTGRVVRTK